MQKKQGLFCFFEIKLWEFLYLITCMRTVPGYAKAPRGMGWREGATRTAERCCGAVLCHNLLSSTAWRTVLGTAEQCHHTTCSSPLPGMQSAALRSSALIQLTFLHCPPSIFPLSSISSFCESFRQNFSFPVSSCLFLSCYGKACFFFPISLYCTILVPDL